MHLLKLAMAVLALAGVPEAAMAASRPAAAAPPTAMSKPLPTLTAKTTFGSGRTVSVHVSLANLQADQFDVAHATASSVTLTYPKRRTTRSPTGVVRHVKPCAQSTFRLAAAPGASNVSDRVDSVFPDADQQGSSGSVSPVSTDDAWRTAQRQSDAFGTLLADGRVHGLLLALRRR